MSGNRWRGLGIAPLAVAVAVGSAAEARQDAEDSVWSFLAAKHDRDRDRRITAAEYDRGETSFARLDKDADGAITEGDCAPREKDKNPFTPEDRRKMLETMAPSMLVRCFADDRTAGLRRDDLLTRFGAIDADRDGKLARAELDAEMQRRRIAPYQMMRMDRFDVLLRASGGEADGALERSALLALFARLDSNGDSLLAGAEVPDLGKAGRRPRENEDQKNARAAAGVVAPDFSLSTHEGEAKVTLSSFAGKRPVALIFGSFT